jgi:hypothetical protein
MLILAVLLCNAGKEFSGVFRVISARASSPLHDGVVRFMT